MPDTTNRCNDSFRAARVIPSDMSFACVVLGNFYKQQHKPSVLITDVVVHPKFLLNALITEG